MKILESVVESSLKKFTKLFIPENETDLIALLKGFSRGNYFGYNLTPPTDLLNSDTTSISNQAELYSNLMGAWSGVNIEHLQAHEYSGEFDLELMGPDPGMGDE